MSKEQTEYHRLLSVTAIRECSEQIFQRALENQTHFQLHLDKLDRVADWVIRVMSIQYPSGHIPLHSRWRHFEINGHDHVDFLKKLALIPQMRARLDLATVSVLLDAGAGPDWVYKDSQGRLWQRSEGLALASLQMFKEGLFSSSPDDLWRVDAAALKSLTLEKLSKAFQASESNPLLGLPGRVELLQRLGGVLTAQSDVFTTGCPSDVYDYLKKFYGAEVSAVDLVKVLLLNGYTLGDMWEYPPLGWIPFHKLTLWLSLSLIEPLTSAGFSITHIEELPGLAEYRNGGLFIDGEVLQLKDLQLKTKVHLPSAAIIVEWRALTLALLERLAISIRKKLNVDARALPLVNILQGGTWQAGRELAFQRDPAGTPPLRYRSTGTIF